MKYINRDVAKIREDMIANAKLLTDRWTDFSESDLGVVLLETVAGTVDMLNYYLDHQALETYLSTATEEKNIRSILQSYNYKFPLNSSSTCIQHFEIPNATHPNNIIIPRNTVVQGTYVYHTTEEVIIPPGEQSVQVPVVQGTLHQRQYLVSTLDNYQKVFTDLTVAKDSVQVYTSTVQLQEVEDAFLEIQGGPFFSIHEDRLGNTYIQFTWDYESYLNPDDILNIDFLETLGDKGQVPAYNLTSLKSEIKDDKGNKVNLITYNIEPSSGGSSEIDLNLVKATAINNIKTMGRLVTLQDYQSYMEAYPGIAKVNCLDFSVEDSNVSSPYQLDIRIVPIDSYTVSEAFRLKLIQDLEAISSIAIDINIKEPEYVPIELDVLLTIDSTEQRASQIKAQVLTTLEKYFSRQNCNFGDNIRLDEIRSVIFNVSPLIVGIDFLTYEMSDYVIRKYQFPRLDTLFVTHQLEV